MILYLSFLGIIVFFSLVQFRETIKSPVTVSTSFRSLNECENNDLSRNKRFVFFFALFALALIIGLRGIGVGTDTAAYYEIYTSSSVVTFPNSFADFIKGEYGYRIINWLFLKAGFSWLGFQLIYGLFISSVICFFVYKYSRSFVSSFFVFVTIGVFPMALTGMRQTLSICFALLMYMSLEKKHYLGFLIFYLVSVLIHYTSLVNIIIVIPFLLIHKAKGIKPSFWLIVGLLIPFAFRFFFKDLLNFFSGFLLDKYSYNGYYSSRNLQLNPLVFLMNWSIYAFIFIGLFVCRKRVSKRTICFYVLSSFYLGFYEATRTVYMVGRLAYYFSFYLVVLLCNVIDFLPLNKSLKRFIYFAVCFVCLLAFVVSTPGSSYGIDNYSFFQLP